MKIWEHPPQPEGDDNDIEPIGEEEAEDASEPLQKPSPDIGEGNSLRPS